MTLSSKSVYSICIYYVYVAMLFKNTTLKKRWKITHPGFVYTACIRKKLLLIS